VEQQPKNMVQIVILGSGTATPLLDRNASGLAIRTPDQWLLADMGPGTLRRMCEAGIDHRWIDMILLTHFHPDHVSDLVPFLFASNYAYSDHRSSPIHLIGPMGLEQFYRGLVGVYGHWIVPTEGRLHKKEMETDGPGTFSHGGITVHSVPSVHTIPSLSYRIETSDVSITISGDSDFSEDLVKLAAGTDVLICECSFPDQMKVPGHMVPSEAGRVAALAGAKRLVLTHFYPPCDEENVINQAAQAFDGVIVKAADLMVIEV
jgi:ribonuclease BN (tRNA processing enzyme)